MFGHITTEKYDEIVIKYTFEITTGKYIIARMILDYSIVRISESRASGGS